MRGISKAFPGVQALEGVDFDLDEGEIHAIVGENGAGKSTLIKILTGVERPDAGVITYAGHKVEVHSPQHAQAMGISTVYQEVNLCPNLTVAENVLIGRAPMKWGRRVDWKAMNAPGQGASSATSSIEIDVTRPLGSYSVAIQQMTAIARALEISSAKVLILDEPTSSLTVHEIDAALPGHAQAAERRHRHRLHHALPRPGLRGERPGHGPPERRGWSARTTRRPCRASSWSR